MSTEELIARLEAATGPERGLEAAVFCFFNAEWEPHVQYIAAVQKVGAPGWSRGFPAVLHSLDAALALVAEQLPGAYGRIEPRFYIQDERVAWRGYTLTPHWGGWTPDPADWFTVTEAEAATAPIALVIALLRALEPA